LAAASCPFANKYIHSTFTGAMMPFVAYLRAICSSGIKVHRHPAHYNQMKGTKITVAVI
jgi:hypothetical protein